MRFHDTLFEWPPSEIGVKLVPQPHWLGKTKRLWYLILKIFAWYDRGDVDPKDAIDLATLFRRYSDGGSMDRLYDGRIASKDSYGNDPRNIRG